MFSTRLDGVMARSVLIVVALCFLLHFQLSNTTQYTNDDSDYEELEYLYKDLPEKRASDSRIDDDFYIAGESDFGEDRNRRVPADAADNEDSDVSSCGTTEASIKWQPPPPPPRVQERVYRYTKHRIPGYDYEELDFVEPRRCDERSVWTHCLCQFTCAKPSMVDCYTPCTSGCECREDYVYDERTGECVEPDQCQPDQDYLLY